MWCFAPQKGPSSSKRKDMRYEILQLKEKCQSALIRERWTFPPFPQNRHYRGWEKQMYHLYPTVSPLSPVQTLVLKHRRTFLPFSLSSSLFFFFSLSPGPLFPFMLTMPDEIRLLGWKFRTSDLFIWHNLLWMLEPCWKRIYHNIFLWASESISCTEKKDKLLFQCKRFAAKSSLGWSGRLKWQTWDSHKSCQARANKKHMWAAATFT